ncbi:MAG TPA: histidine phosphatase family protein [Methyloceanibacter sp.]|jgi:phosphohistidine phosphatase|nr:histidine phosphatase family protein [Methyloceanibacter sp.]
MLTLSLLRHAKSSWKTPALPDQDRPLASRGLTDAPLMGKAMAERGIDPDLVLCSSARRTRDTLALVLPELKVEPQVIYEDRLYHPTAEELLERIRAIQPGSSRVMLVGHNPELQAFALDLVGAGPKHLLDRLREKFPTAGLAVINFPAGLWKSVTVNSGTLNLFLSPKELKG